jgi:tetratricopeptide repeat protein 30
MAKIYWDIGNYPKVEKILLESEEFCSEHDTWKLNMAHALFMQENKFKDAIRYYEPIVEQQKDRLLEVPAMVLANLCVSYIMTIQNDEAEEWMKCIEKEEDIMAKKNPGKQSLHLCIINLVIGTLYSSKAHYDFGISRVMKSLEPYNKKIMTDTWFYTKRCFLYLAEILAKHMMLIPDACFNEILTFLDAVAMVARDVTTAISPNTAGAFASTDIAINMDDSTQIKEERTVTAEARLLKKMFLMLRP